MKNVAVLQFPGINSEYETRRALWDAGMDSEFFRWNDSPSKLRDFDGYVIAGGFSYEDRGRAGLVASMDPIMDVIKEEANKGKPVLGICNGAQILVETGLVPGGKNEELLMCLARNKRMRDGKILGVGFYNENVHIKSMSEKGRTAFTIDFEPGDIDLVPVAHGEGRFTTSIKSLFSKLEENGQIVFKYCTEEGEEESEFPVNPNGAMHNAAAVSNAAGNVMAIMPHPERAPVAPMPKIFTSMRKYMEGEELVGSVEALDFEEDKPEMGAYKHSPNSIEMFVKLIITDNEAQTIENALRQRGFDVKLDKWIHYQVDHKVGADQDILAQALVDSGELLNTNKETVRLVTDDKCELPDRESGVSYFLVRDKDDAEGAAKTVKIKHHMSGDEVDIIHHGWFWRVEGDVDIDALLATNIFANHHAQVLYRV